MKKSSNLLYPFATLGILLMLSVFFSPHAAAQYNFKSDPSDPAVLSRVEAKVNTNKFVWFSVGCGTGAVSMYLAGRGAHSLVTEDSSYGSSRGLSYGQIFAGLGLATAFQTAIYIGNSPPSTDRLIGKSPEYVEVYIAAYKEEKLEIKNTWGNLGFLLGVTGGALAFLSTLE